MGNQLITPKKSAGDFSKLDVLDQLATKFILTQNFQDMRKLSTKEYCNKLIILTGDIIKNALNEKEIEYLSYKLTDGVPVNQMKKKRIAFLKKAAPGTLDVKNHITKDRMCKGIAKFYVKIAHLYAAILKTINPIYIFTGFDRENTPIFF